ncbi:tRNA pseudouridine(38-40) synthase TruA [Sporolactobacillus sp. THM19-2]|jgi:tRNA pseudouridine38-40 synthase|uniref:tRNA pseudouridine(38-40) synthase TruA n=1 Tax=Sporolactobacillus sp. THM19-2 TaxID=2511171 RepID=UPI00101F2788|nr:tRNA pseudouridine(38-40) synthase TruA [Sporolactobacillus sp. THM19-2]RYL94143.1 tRNA pseudouridine(38-40) synthase TruA [Sporolactobacillus sp. THM19-2]
MNYKLMIEYDGGRYKGWQRLGAEEKTIQGKIEQALSQLEGRPVEIVGSSRTDAGVHALGQVANVRLDTPQTGDGIKNFLNHYLPEDISITRITRVPERFHARYHAKGKTYLYKIWNGDYSHPFLRKYSMHIPEKLDLGRMQKAASFFIGEHDFTAYSNAKSKKKSSVCRITSLNIEEQDGLIQIRICGNRFLYNMVRKIVGSLIEAGLCRLDPDQVPEILKAKKRNRTGRLAEARGLYLESVDY